MAEIEAVTIEEFKEYEQIRTPDFAAIASYVNRAKGPDRTMAQFAEVTQIGASTLSRIVNGKSTKPLSKENIIRIFECRAIQDDVHLLDLLARANGMFPKEVADRVKSDDRFAGKRNEIINRERMMKNALIAGTVSCGLPVKQVINAPRVCRGCDQFPTIYPRKRGDFILDLDTENNLSPVKSWTFFLDADFVDENEENAMLQEAKRDVRYMVEKMSGWFLIDAWMPHLLKGSKFSFVFLDGMVFEEFKEALKDAKVHTEMSLILLDKTTYSVSTEVWLPGTYDKLTEISIFENPAPIEDEYDEDDNNETEDDE